MDRYAILSNVNGNEEALAAVLNDIKQEGIRTVILLGDAIGIGQPTVPRRLKPLPYYHSKK